MLNRRTLLIVLLGVFLVAMNVGPVHLKKIIAKGVEVSGTWRGEFKKGPAITHVAFSARPWTIKTGRRRGTARMRKMQGLAILGVSLIVLVGEKGFFVPRDAEANGVYSCECIDKSDIQQKIDEAEAAIKGYQAQMANLQGQPYTKAARVALQNKVQQAVDQAMKGRRSLRSFGYVSNICSLNVEGPTPCLRQATAMHEEVHQKACTKTGTPAKIIESILTGKDRFERDNATMTDYVQEEIAGYNAGLAYLKEQLAALSKCP